jgi:hypothetical protein
MRPRLQNTAPGFPGVPVASETDALHLGMHSNEAFLGGNFSFYRLSNPGIFKNICDYLFLFISLDLLVIILKLTSDPHVRCLLAEPFVNKFLHFRFDKI